MFHQLRASSWIWLLSLYTVASFVEVVFWGQMTAFTPLYLAHFGIAEGDVKAWTGVIAAISTLVGVPFLPLWGALADRYTRQPVIVRSFAAHFLGGAVILLAGNVWLFLVGRAVMSFALGNSGLMMTTLSERTPKHRVGFAFSLMNSAGPVGALLGPLVGGPIVDRWGFPTLVAIDAVLLLAVIFALSLGYKDDFKGTQGGSLFQMALDGVGVIWRSPRLRTLFPALFLLFAGWMLAFAYVPLVVKELYRGNDLGTATGIVVGAGGLLTLILSPLLGILADRHGYWRVLFISASVSVLLWPLPALTSDIVSFGIAWAVINGLSSSVFAISFIVLANSAANNVRGRVMTFSYLPVNMGFAIGPAIGSAITQVSLYAVFPAAAVLTLLGIGTLALASRQPITNDTVERRVAEAPETT